LACIVLDPSSLCEPLFFVQIIGLISGKAIIWGETIIVIDGEQISLPPRIRHDGGDSSGWVVLWKGKGCGTLLWF
jgi:hypothetical protein